MERSVKANKPFFLWHNAARMDVYSHLVTKWAGITDARRGGWRRKSMMEFVAVTHAGMKTGQFEKLMKAWIATAKPPVTKRPIGGMVYQPTSANRTSAIGTKASTRPQTMVGLS